MSAYSGAPRDVTYTPVLRVQIGRLRNAMLWMFVAIGALVIFEPSPYEIMFVFTAATFAITGLKLNPLMIPLAVLLLAFNIGGALSLIPFLNLERSVMFVIISFYMMFTTLFFAALMTEDTAARLEIIRSGYIAAAWVAGVAAVLGYFDVGGLESVFTRYHRASGTFKDPNVLGPFLVLPIVYLVQDLLLRRAGILRTVLLVSVPIFALFLSFSRGAWGDLIAALVLLLSLHFVTSTSNNERARFVLIGALGIAVLAGALVVALSFEDIRRVFEIRASLDQSYDVGAAGRFGRQLRAIPMLLELPNGFGPLRFRDYFFEDAHNVYINAFASYGWLGGLSYLTLIALTLILGWRTVFRHTPYQSHAIAIWATLFVTILQGLQIDTDHWRHFFLMLGLIWGLAAVSLKAASLPTAR